MHGTALTTEAVATATEEEGSGSEAVATATEEEGSGSAAAGLGWEGSGSAAAGLGLEAVATATAAVATAKVAAGSEQSARGAVATTASGLEGLAAIAEGRQRFGQKVVSPSWARATGLQPSPRPGAKGW